MARLTAFIGAAKQTLDFAVYDMRFSDPLRAQLVSALRECAEAGVKIRFCYDGDKPAQPNVADGQDPAPAGTGAFVQSLGYPWRRIAGMRFTGAPRKGFRPRPLFEIFVPEYWEHNYGSGELIRDKIVIVGAEGKWQKDELNTPFGDRKSVV